MGIVIEDWNGQTVGTTSLHLQVDEQDLLNKSSASYNIGTIWYENILFLQQHHCGHLLRLIKALQKNKRKCVWTLIVSSDLPFIFVVLSYFQKFFLFTVRYWTFLDCRQGTFLQEEFEDIKEVNRVRISKKNRQHNANGQEIKYKRTNNDLRNLHIKLKIEQYEPH